MKLWDKGYSIDNIVERFTVGKDRELDLVLAKYDVRGSMAHARMLSSIGIMEPEELDDVIRALEEILLTIENGDFYIEETFEDVHSKIEYELVDRIGEAGKKIHTARSRNDQVLVDLHLYLKDEIVKVEELIQILFDELLKLSEQNKFVFLPGYTHLQIAMPSTFGLWFGSYAETLIDDVIQLNAAYEIADQNPLGSAAGYGSSFPIDRKMTTDLLNFSSMKFNSAASQMSRGKLEKSVAFGLSSLASTLSKFAADICLYSSQNFDFVGFPRELTTGSSIMPHKKNPDVFELVRAKCNKVQSLPTEVMLITNNLTTGYHRDFQLLKEGIMESIETMKDILEVVTFMVGHITINTALLEDSKYHEIFSVEEVNELVKKGMSFREAYQEVALLIDSGKYKPDIKLPTHSHEGSIGNLCTEEIRLKMARHQNKP
ncbi:MAG: argininosuccinate lyase [Flavobacteriales bacterium]|nr:argininosuccinate lyase [Flavobacteriales bacterium]